jgi:hypothetical protein
MVLRFGLIGTPAMITERVEIYRNAGIGTINLRFPQTGTPLSIDTLAQAIEAIRR